MKKLASDGGGRLRPQAARGFLNRAQSLMPALAAVVFAACAGDGTTAIDTTAKVRFFNAVWSAQDNIGFTANNEFVAGTSLGYLQSTPSCSSLNSGNTSLAIGLANTSGTGLNSDPFVMLTNQNIAEGGNYTVLAGGNVNHPSVVLLNNSFSGTLGANQAAIRFVNLAGGSAGPIDVLKGTAESGSTSVVQANMGFRDATPFSTVASGANPYTIKYNGANDVLLSGSDGTLNLQAGTINTIVVSRLNPPDGNFKLINLPSCS
jgi:hypothetical protein